MKTIEIAPKLGNITCSDRRITAKWNERTLIYELPEGSEFSNESEWCKYFQGAIGLSSKPWQIERLMNDATGCNGKFWEE